MFSLLLGPGCGGSGGSGPTTPPSGFNSPISLTMIPFRDPWTAARQRMWDIDDRPLETFIRNGFSYNVASVSLTYDAAPSVPYFVGKIRARGLKPNFCYQLKLAGKPRDGIRGWKSFGDDAANERIGRAARWWCDTQQRNETDEHFDELYKNVAPAQRHSIYGYQYLGFFVTDAAGNADIAFNGAASYHVTWQDKQDTYQHVDAGTFAIGTSSPFYGYGKSVPTANIKLWYELEPGRAQPVRLPAGRYNCRLLITEESFHNQFGGTDDPNGGFWLTVLASEDFSGGQPDTSAANDVVFTIK
ncbi:MAG TPA: hypothetical protein VF719_02480 [Abditibacteriaceae bacterium]